MTKSKIRRALISVSDKTGLLPFAQALAGLGIELISTGGTALYLRDHGLAVTNVADVTGFPEILEGRVKTLHPAIHGGILANVDQASHRNDLMAHGISPIGLVIVNLYPFEDSARTAGSRATVIEHIDIGGSALLRASAKNHAHVTVVCDPVDYGEVVKQLKANDGDVPIEARTRFAAKAFALTASYDAAIAAWFADGDASTPNQLLVTATLKQRLRYGENPHQQGAVYQSTRTNGPSIVQARQVQGKELSYNNFADADAAFELISEFNPAVPAVAIIKHANPCGVATGQSWVEAYNRAFACDPVSAFGGIVALNGVLDEDAARTVLSVFTEVVIATDATDAAQRAFEKKPGVRLLLTDGLLDRSHRLPNLRSVSGGFLMQDADVFESDPSHWRTVTRFKPTGHQQQDLLFAMRVAKHVKSNAIVFAKDGATLGIGAGQMSRVDSVRLAVWKAADTARARGASRIVCKDRSLRPTRSFRSPMA